MKLIKDYDCKIEYHPKKTNVVADALSIKNPSRESRRRITLLKELRGCKAILTGSVGNLIALFQIQPTLEENIIRSQPKDPISRNLTEEVRCEKCTDYTIRNDGVLLKDKRLCVPHNKALKDSILKEVHSSAYVMHPGSTKMYKTLKAYYWQPIMQHEIAKYIAKCLDLPSSQTSS